jgi:hypothetical protein
MFMKTISFLVYEHAVLSYVSGALEILAGGTRKEDA